MIARLALAFTVVAACAACDLLAPPSTTDYGKACGPDVECGGDLACIDGFCQPGSVPDDDAGAADGG